MRPEDNALAAYDNTPTLDFCRTVLFIHRMSPSKGQELRRFRMHPSLAASLKLELSRSAPTMNTANADGAFHVLGLRVEEDAHLMGLIAE